MKRAPPLLVLAACMVAMWLVAAPVETRPAWHLLAAVLLAGTGVAIALAGVLQFRHAGTTVDPRVPHKAQTLVVAGVFRYTRNPMYVGMLLVLCGWAVALGSTLAALACPAFFLWIDRLQIPFEERHISARFGDAYLSYCQQVRRWL